MPQTIEVYFQLSLGRFSIELNEDETIRDAKKKLRTTHAAQLLQVNMNAFRLINNNGTYLSDESKKLKDVGVGAGDLLHFVKKNACANALLDTEVPVDE